MAQLPKPELLIAGFLVQISARVAISWTEKDFDRIMSITSGMCRNNGLLILLLGLISVGVSIITFYRGRSSCQAFVTFTASFLINFSGDGLGYLTVHCFEYVSRKSNPEDPGKKLPIVEYYSFIAFPIMAMAFLGILVNYLKKPAASRATKAPDAELILLGICAQFTVWHAFPIFVGEPNKSYNKLCADRGAGSWSDLFAISCLLATLAVIKTRNSEVRKARAAYTFLTSGVLNLLSGGAGRLAIVCLTKFENLDDYSTYSTALSLIYACISMLVNALVAFKILTYHLFIKESPTDEPEQPEEGINAQTTRNVLESICSFSICN